MKVEVDLYGARDKDKNAAGIFVHRSGPWMPAIRFNLVHVTDQSQYVNLSAAAFHMQAHERCCRIQRCWICTVAAAGSDGPGGLVPRREAGPGRPPRFPQIRFVWLREI